MNQGEQKQQRAGSFGLALILAGVFFLVFARDIGRSGLTADNDPGPRAVPVAISILLLAGGIFELAANLWCQLKLVITTPNDGPLALNAPLSRDGLINVLVLTASLLVFFVLVYCVGFLGSTFVFAFFMTWWLKAGWWQSLVFAVALVSVIYVLFVRMFEVALPSGLLEIYF